MLQCNMRAMAWARPFTLASGSQASIPGFKCSFRASLNSQSECELLLVTGRSRVNAPSHHDVEVGRTAPLLGSSQASDLIARATGIFPNLAIELADDRADRSLDARMVADHPITHLVSPATTVDASGKLAARSGLARHVKLVWQLSGAMVYEDAHRSFVVSAGELIVLPMSQTYRLAMNAQYEGLVLVFDPATVPAWGGAAGRACGRAIGANAALAAAAAGASALLRHADGGPADRLAVQSVIDLVLASIVAREADDRPLALHSSGLRRACLLVGHHIADEAYGPDQLARDLGLSRRSLYNRFARLGLTPAGFIRRQRLEHARHEILRDQACRLSLAAIALNSGFPDGASFSHAFKAAYGMAPSQLRPARTL
jgi:AraC-like DNA-binding protein